MKLLLRSCVSKSGKFYKVLSVDLGYRIVNLSFDSLTICEISGLTVEELYSLPSGNDYVLSTFSVTKIK